MIAALLAIGEYLLIGVSLASIGFAVWTNLSPAQKAKLINSVTNVVRAALAGATELLNEVEPVLEPVVQAFIAGFQKFGPTISQDVRAPVEALVKASLAEKQAALLAMGESTPDNFAAVAGAAMADAYGFGIGSFISAAAFEAAFPEKLNVLSGAGPILHSLAGFDEVTAEALAPLYRNAFGRSAEYHYRSVFKPELPDEQDAVRWHSRGLLTDDQLREIFKFSGLKQQYEAAFVQSAYRPVSPFVLAAGYINADLPTQQLYDAMKFMGLRPQDQDLMFHTIEVRSLQQTRQALVGAALTAYGKGVVADAELQQILTDAGYGKAASALVMQHALILRRSTLASESESFVVPEVTAGLLTPTEGAQALEAAGVQPWQADLKMTLAQTKQALVAARKAAAAERRLEIQRQREATRVGISSYETGAIDDAGLTAALIAIGLDPVLVGSVVAVEAAKRAGRIKLVYGQLLTPAKAKVLTEQVAALEGQFKKQLIDEPNLRAQLAALNVDGPETEALVARWAAARTAATKTGYEVPIR